MADEELIGAVKSGLARGQSIDSIMQSLSNAGYKESNIEEAIRIARSSVQSQQTMPVQPIKKIPSQFKSPTQPFPSSQPAEEKQGVVERESKYEYIPKSVKTAPMFGKVLIVILGILFILLLGGLIIILFFKDKVMQLFGLQ